MTYIEDCLLMQECVCICNEKLTTYEVLQKMYSKIHVCEEKRFVTCMSCDWAGGWVL